MTVGTLDSAIAGRMTAASRSALSTPTNTQLVSDEVLRLLQRPGWDESDPMGRLRSLELEVGVENRELHDLAKTMLGPSGYEIVRGKNLGLLKRLNEICLPEDLTVWKLFCFGGSCVGTPHWPKHWPAAPSPRFASADLTEGVPKGFTQGSVHSFKRRGCPDWMGEELLQHCWDSSLQEVRDGLLLGPFSLEDWEKEHPGTLLAMRFAVEQSDKIRMCDDMRCLNQFSDWDRKIPLPTSTSNLAMATAVYDSLAAGSVAPDSGSYRVYPRRRRVGEPSDGSSSFVPGSSSISAPPPVVPPAPVPVGSAASPISGSPATSAGVAPPDSNPHLDPASAGSSGSSDVASPLVAAILADVKNAYKTIPMAPRFRKYNAIAVWHPAEQCFKVFVGLTLLFGNVHSVSEWVRFSQLLKNIMIRFMGIPTDIYIDDQVSFAPTHCAMKYKNIVQQLWIKLGVEFKPHKAICSVEHFNRLPILGLEFLFEGRPMAQISSERIGALQKAITDVLAADYLTRGAASKLLGKISFVVSSMLDRRFNPVLRPLVSFVFSGRSGGSLPAGLRGSLTAVLNLLPNLPKKSLRSTRPAVILSSDASWRKGRGSIAGTLFDEASGSCRGWYMTLAAEDIPEHLRRSPINWLEACAAIINLRYFASELRGSDIVCAIDNSAAQDLLMNMSSKKAHLAGTAFLFWTEVSLLGASAWVTRVASEDNIADLLTHVNIRRLIPTFVDMVFSEASLDEFSARHLLQGLGTIFDAIAGDLPVPTIDAVSIAPILKKSSSNRNKNCRVSFGFEQVRKFPIERQTAGPFIARNPEHARLPAMPGSEGSLVLSTL